MAEIPDNIRTWLADCVAEGYGMDTIRLILQEQNFSEDVIEKEIHELASHPYMSSLRSRSLTVKRREWVLELQDSKARAAGKYSKKVPVKTKMPPFKKFLKDYYYENRPVLFKGAAKDWPAMKWTFEDIKKKIGNHEVEVQANRSHDPMYERYIHKYKTLMGFHEFIDRVATMGRSNDLYLTANNFSKSFDVYKPLYNDLGVLGDGYLNMNTIKGEMFLWIGPEGTITHVHHDLRDNLFVQIYGRKRFTLIPASQVGFLYNRDHVFSEMDVLNPNLKRFPKFENATVMEVIVNPGDCLYVPVGWWHAVESLDTSISFSSCNLSIEDDYFKKFHQKMATAD